MAIAELILRFPAGNQVEVALADTASGPQPFANPLTARDRTDIAWYIETYAAHSLADPDDAEAARIRERLPGIGQALFDAVFGTRPAQRIFNAFQDTEAAQRVLTIETRDAAILSLPWELLHDPDGVYLFRERPHISVRRRIPGVTGGRAAFQVVPKDRLHLLFVVSRPSDAGFIDPRADPAAVLDAIAAEAPGRVSWELLRPATLDALIARLDDDTRPPIDILHFDGHGVFRQVTEAEVEAHPERYGRTIHSEIQRERSARGVDADQKGIPVGIGFLAFEQPQLDRQGFGMAEPGTLHLVGAADLAAALHRARVGLVVLSACQGAALGEDSTDPLAGVAGGLAGTGIPAILAMTHSVLVATTRTLFARFYRGLAMGRGLATALDDARVHLATYPAKFQVRRGRRWQPLELQDWFLPALFHGGTDQPLLTRTDGPPTTPPASTAPGNLRPPREAGFFGRRWELWQIERRLAVEGTRRGLDHRLRRPGQDRARPGGRPLADPHRPLRHRGLRRLRPGPGRCGGGRRRDHRERARRDPERRRRGHRGPGADPDPVDPRQPGGPARRRPAGPAGCRDPLVRGRRLPLPIAPCGRCSRHS